MASRVPTTHAFTISGEGVMRQTFISRRDIKCVIRRTGILTGEDPADEEPEGLLLNGRLYKDVFVKMLPRAPRNETPMGWM